MKLVTFKTIKDRIRELGELRTSFVSDSSLDTEVNQSRLELYDKLISAGANDYFYETQLVNVVADTNSYALSTNFYKALSVEVKNSEGQYLPLFPYSWEEYGSNESTSCRTETGYRFKGNYIYFAPTPSWTETNGIAIRYAPVPDALVNPTDTVDGVNGWEDYIVYDVIIKFCAKDERDARDFKELFGKIDARIEKMKKNRDRKNSSYIRDVDQEMIWSPWKKY
jgi:hypothetical protein